MLVCAFIAELWGVVEGLCLAQRLDFTKIELCIGFQAAVRVITIGKTKGMVLKIKLSLQWVLVAPVVLVFAVVLLGVLVDGCVLLVAVASCGC
ncbi:unnamed protein product [Trifolium pratense]|uniref:Uncharacterized protein n=1 Tax=Trifolium pratense TaxID=57577 RepID=A0ACB0ICR4_TRIPR|nr:unnamed protein product [Trifolium pratense]